MCLRNILPELKDGIILTGDKDLNLQRTKVKSVIFHPTCVDATHFKVHWISRFTILLVFATFFLVRLRKKEAVMRVVTLR